MWRFSMVLNLVRRILCPDYSRRDSNWQQDEQDVMHHAYTHGFHDSIEHAYKEGDSNDMSIQAKPKPKKSKPV